MVTKQGLDFLFNLNEDLAYCTESEKKSCLTGAKDGLALYLAMLCSSDMQSAVSVVSVCFLSGVGVISLRESILRSLDRKEIVCEMPTLSLIDNGIYMSSLRKGFDFGRDICNYYLELWGWNKYFGKTVKMIKFQQSVLQLYDKTFFEGLGAS